ncbi:MAG: DNA-processing protein DprA [Myxococcota bacterium]|nr:DNA-processing protein DprA [Myxococcota bacterium]
MTNRYHENKTKRVIGSASKISIGHPDYPSELQQLTDSPKCLYVLGRIPVGPMVAIVGSRAADPAAKRFVLGLAADLTAHGLVVISGGAEGIDTAAHQGALEAGGVTVAIIGSGFDFMYPKANASLFEKIATRGALVTEFAPEQPPTKWTFPRRNRLVAAMAGAVVVSQAGETSGALITARIAKNLGIPLGAVPGPAGDARYRGSHQLLRSGASLVESAEDVLSIVAHAGPRNQMPLPGLASHPQKTASQHVPTPEEVKILDILGSGPIHIDEIITATGLSPGKVTAAVLSLEIVGFVEDQGGKRYVKLD